MAHLAVEPSEECLIANGPIAFQYPEVQKRGNAVSDEELVERSLRGEEAAFRCLYERYRGPVYAAVCRIVRDLDDAHDTTQEVFITVYRSLSLWNPRRSRFSSWIYRIAVNRAIDHWRIQRRRAEHQLAESAETLSSCAALCWGRMRSIERTLESRARAAEVRRFLEELPQPQRRFFILRYYEGLKLREIAEHENCKLGTVKSSLHRAVKIMRRKLNER
jgi:RNA polymerase sigma-70 factor (ECF subfamily)